MKALPPPGDRITERFVKSLCSRLAEGKTVRRTLPRGGRIHIDRQLPFLFVHRYPSGGVDKKVGALIRGESSSLVASADHSQHKGTALLVRSIAATMRAVFGSFLVLELWASDELDDTEDCDEFEPVFGIAIPKGKALDSTARELQTDLCRIKIKRRKARATVLTGGRIAPPGLPLLIPTREIGKGAWCVGLAIRPVHWDDTLGSTYPLIRRALHRGLARSLKKGAFEFMRLHTNRRLPHFHSLGRRSMVKAVWEVDRKLAELSNGFDSLLLVTPTNPRSAWGTFQRRRYAKEPHFEYRALPFDPALAKRKLFQIPVERIEDPTLELMFREQQSTLDRKFGMLGARGTDRFRYASLELFGDVGPELLAVALGILSRVPATVRERSRGEVFDAETFAARARAEIERYRAGYPELTSRVEVRSDLIGLMVSKGNLLVSSESRIPGNRVDALIAHEVGTHVLTYVNGRAQPFQQLHIGLPGYDELQEGLAVLSEYLVGGFSRPRLRLLAARVVAVRRMAAGASFLEVFHELVDGHGFARQTAFHITMRVFRSGGLAKDAVYLKGLIELLEYLRGGGSLDPLYVGKLAVAHVPMIEELQWRGVLRPMPLRPYHLDTPEARERLERVRNGLTVEQLAQ